MKKILVYKNINLCFKNKNLICSNGLFIKHIYKYQKKLGKKYIYLIPVFQLKLFINNFIHFYKNVCKQKIYFFELKVYGLGFKISITTQNVLRLDLGWSHALLFRLNNDIKLIKKKAEMLFYSFNQTKLSNFVVLLKKIYKRSPYHVKGIFSLHEEVKTKLGKQRQR